MTPLPADVVLSDLSPALQADINDDGKLGLNEGLPLFTHPNSGPKHRDPFLDKLPQMRYDIAQRACAPITRTARHRQVTTQLAFALMVGFILDFLVVMRTPDTNLFAECSGFRLNAVCSGRQAWS